MDKMAVRWGVWRFIMFKAFLVGLAALLFAPGFLCAQQTPPGNNNGQVFGISVNPEGVIEYRQKDANAELAKVKARRPTKDGGNDLRFVSLVKLFSDLKNSVEGGKEISNEVKYLSGITQLRYILVYPEQNDLVIGGMGEEIDASNPMQPRGKV